jgi:hypothetical protein
MEDLEHPNPPVDPETVNRDFYQLDKVREAVLIFDKINVILFPQMHDIVGIIYAAG